MITPCGRLLILVRPRLSLLLLLALALAGCSSPAVEPIPEPAAKLQSVQPGSKQAANATAQAQSQPIAPPPIVSGTLSDLQSRLSEADNLLLAGQNREAADLLLRVVGAQPDSPGAWDLLTLALIRLGEPGVATRTGARAVQLQPEGATIRFNTGLAHFNANEPLQAATHLREAAQLNQVRPEPLIYLALSATGDEAQAALHELETRFPGDPSIQMVRTALALQGGDLDGDGAPEVITKANGQLTVANGATGGLYLQVPIANEKVWTFFGEMGDEGRRFLVINDPNGSSSLYVLDGNQFAQVTGLMGTAYFDRAARELHLEYQNRQTGEHTRKGYTYQNGALIELYSVVTPSEKGTQKPEPLQDDVELFLAVMKWQQRAYASPGLGQEVMAKDTGKWGLIPFLLPTRSGYRLELWQSEQPLIKASAVVNKDRRIEKLTWE